MPIGLYRAEFVESRFSSSIRRYFGTAWYKGIIRVVCIVSNCELEERSNIVWESRQAVKEGTEQRESSKRVASSGLVHWEASVSIEQC